MPAEVMKQPSGIAPIRVTRPSLKLSPSDSDLNVRFATGRRKSSCILTAINWCIFLVRCSAFGERITDSVLMKSENAFHV